MKSWVRKWNVDAEKLIRLIEFLSMEMFLRLHFERQSKPIRLREKVFDAWLPEKKSNRWRESMKNTFLIDFHLMNSWRRRSRCLYWDLELDGERSRIKVEEETDRQTDREREKERQTDISVDWPRRKEFVRWLGSAANLIESTLMDSCQ